MLKLGVLFLLVRFLFLSVLPTKAVFIYIVRSSRFIPSPCFILSPESSFYIYLVGVLNPVRGQSVVHSTQFVFYTDQFTLYWIAFRDDTKSYPVKYEHPFGM